MGNRLSPWWRLLLGLGLISAYVMFSYGGRWWQPAWGTGLIICVARGLWGPQSVARIGLDISRRGLLATGLCLGIVTLGSWWMVTTIAMGHGVAVFPGTWKGYFHGFFYTLNEEMVLGALLVLTCIERWRLPRVAISGLLALAFALVHFVFFKWLFFNQGVTQPDTLATLFFVGILRNNLIITFRHIGYAWALHFGWIAIMLDSPQIAVKTSEWLTEIERFNLYLGSAEMLTLSGVLALGSVFFLLRDNHNRVVGIRD
jgi:hypothetical protein